MQLVEGDLEAPQGLLALHRSHAEERHFLACVSRPVGDCVIDASVMGIVEDDLLAGARHQEFWAEIEFAEVRARRLYGLRLRLLEPTTMRFSAGQFVNVELPRSSELRTYSIASPPSRDGRLDLFVKLHAGGRFSRMLQDGLAPGTRMRVFGPFGGLRVRLSYRPIIMVANGSGLAPMLSMLADLAEKRNERHVRFFYSARSFEDLFAQDELSDIQRRMPALELVPVLTRAWPADWRGETGLLADVIRRRITSAVDHDAYLCGSSWCVEEMLPLLTQLGIKRRNIHLEVFTPAAHD